MKTRDLRDPIGFDQQIKVGAGSIIILIGNIKIMLQFFNMFGLCLILTHART